MGRGVPATLRGDGGGGSDGGVVASPVMDRRTFIKAAAGALASSAGSSSQVFAGVSAVAGESTPSELAGHRIGAVEFRDVRLPWPRLVGRNAVKGVHGRGPTVRVAVLKTDQGAVGWGQTRGDAKAVDAAAERLRGRRLSDVFDPAAGVWADHLLDLDAPLHDLAGVVLGVPVWKMLGAGRPFVTKVYSGMIYFDDLDPPDDPAGIDAVLENCRRDHEYGYRQFKVKVGRGHRWMEPEAGLRRDVEVVRQIAAAFPDCELLVDGNDGFTADGFIEFLEGITPTPLVWIEEPFRETLADWRKLADWTRANGYGDTHLADGEFRPDFDVIEQLEAEGTLTLRLTDIVDAGFTTWRRWMPQLQRQNVAASPHTWASGLKTVYAAQLVGGLGNAPTVEGVTCGDVDVDFGDNQIVDGKFLPSNAPGFGLTLRG